MKALIKTNKGDMKIEFFDEDAPNTVSNFVKLAQDGYYDGLKWHRVIPDFVIQGGCPNSRDGESGMAGTGGPGYQIDCELDGGNQHHDKGVLSMAHAGRNTGGSQFFVCHSRANTGHLDGVHTCFGKVIEGLEVIDAIVEGDAIEEIRVLITSIFNVRLFPEEIYFLSQMPSEINMSYIIVISLFSLLITFLATIFPSLSAAKLDPVKALKYE